MTKMETRKKYTLAELDQERREIEKEFEGAETDRPGEFIVHPDLQIRHITDGEAERIRLRPSPEEQRAAAKERS